MKWLNAPLSFTKEIRIKYSSSIQMGLALISDESSSTSTAHPLIIPSARYSHSPHCHYYAGSVWSRAAGPCSNSRPPGPIWPPACTLFRPACWLHRWKINCQLHFPIIQWKCVPLTLPPPPTPNSPASLAANGEYSADVQFLQLAVIIALHFGDWHDQQQHRQRPHKVFAHVLQERRHT